MKKFTIKFVRPPCNMTGALWGDIVLQLSGFANQSAIGRSEGRYVFTLASADCKSCIPLEIAH